MKRNRKYKSAAIRFGPALKAFLLCLLIGGSAIGYVWQKNQISRLGNEISEREHRLKGLQDQNGKLSNQLSLMRRPAFLEMRVRELNLGLQQPEPGQIWRLPEPPRDWPAPDPDRQYAAQGEARRESP